MDYDNPSLEDLRRFEKALFDRLLLEPVTDPDFARPSGKLAFLVQQSQEMIVTLRRVVAGYDQLSEFHSQTHKILADAKSYMDMVETFAFQSPPIDEALSEITLLASLPSEERKAYWERQRAERLLQQEARTLCIEFLPINGELSSLNLAFLTSQLLAAQLWAFLVKTAAAIIVGTQQFFPDYAVPSNMQELFSDVINEVVKEAGLPDVTPVKHILKAMLGFIGRKERAEGKADASRVSFELHSFLLMYFGWWTEGDGRLTVEDIVSNCEESLRSHTESAKAFGKKVGSFGRALSRFQADLQRLPE
jgi:hypothetical protein